MIIRSTEICQLHEEIRENVQKHLYTPQEAQEMENYMSSLMLKQGNIADMIWDWWRDLTFIVGIDHNLSEQLEELVWKVYWWPKMINDIIDEAEKQHREERYVIERKIIKRK